MSLAVPVIALAVAAGVIILLYKFKTWIMSAFYVASILFTVWIVCTIILYGVMTRTTHCFSFRYYAVLDLENCSTNTHGKHRTEQFPLQNCRLLKRIFILLNSIIIINKHYVYISCFSFRRSKKGRQKE